MNELDEKELMQMITETVVKAMEDNASSLDEEYKKLIYPGMITDYGLVCDLIRANNNYLQKCFIDSLPDILEKIGMTKQNENK